MKTLCIKTLSLFLIASLSRFSATAWANTFVPPVPEIAGKAYYLLDYFGNRPIVTHNPDMRIEPASLTKLMTAYLTFKALREKRLAQDQLLTVSKRGWRTEGSRMFLDPKHPARVDELIKGVIVQSGNDACVTLAEAIGGTEDVFAQMMTREAKRLGMHNTQFRNSTGLPDPNHYTTVRDLAVLSSAIIRDFPEFYPIYSIRSFTYNRITQPNRNLLLYRDPDVDGMKTGYTEVAGYNLIVSSRRDGRRLISVLVGAASPEARAEESAKLLNYGLQFFDTPKLYAADRTVSTVPVYKGSTATLAVGFNQDVYATVTKGEAGRLKSRLSMVQPLVAPIKKGQRVGTLTVLLDEKAVTERPVVALGAVEEGGVFTRLWDSIRLFF